MPPESDTTKSFSLCRRFRDYLKYVRLPGLFSPKACVDELHPLVVDLLLPFVPHRHAWNEKSAKYSSFLRKGHSLVIGKEVSYYGGNISKPHSSLLQSRNFLILLPLKIEMNVTTAYENNRDEGGIFSQGIRIGVISALVVVYLLLTQNTAHSQKSLSTFWASHPYTGVKKQWFSWFRATIRSIFSCKAMTDEGYAKVRLFSRKDEDYLVSYGYQFSRLNSIFITPSIDRGAFVVVPPAQLKQIYGLPESQLDVHSSQTETIQAKYTVGSPDIFDNAFHVNVVRNQITRNIALFTPAIAEELELGFDKYWGNSTDWRTVEAWPTILKIVSGAANRVFLGTPYCSYFET
jgi:hypothetical protein